MKTVKTVPAIATAALLLTTGILLSAAAPQTGRPRTPLNRIFSERLHQQLNLMPDQDRRWLALENEEESLRKEIKQSFMELHGAADAEFAKPRPDLAALSSIADSAHEQIYAARKDFRKHALAFYSGLSPKQQAIVISVIKEKRQPMERVLEKRHLHNNVES